MGVEVMEQGILRSEPLEGCDNGTCNLLFLYGFYFQGHPPQKKDRSSKAPENIKIWNVLIIKIQILVLFQKDGGSYW